MIQFKAQNQSGTTTFILCRAEQLHANVECHLNSFHCIISIMADRDYWLQWFSMTMRWSRCEVMNATSLRFFFRFLKLWPVCVTNVLLLTWANIHTPGIFTSNKKAARCLLSKQTFTIPNSLRPEARSFLRHKPINASAFYPIRWDNKNQFTSRLKHRMSSSNKIRPQTTLIRCSHFPP